MKSALKGFIGAILVMGVLRFMLDYLGVSHDVVKYFSMSAIILVGCVYCALQSGTHKDRLKAAYLLILPYMLIEVLALAYTWGSGRSTIFHTAEYSLGTSLPVHTIGHFVGGLTWEPLSVFIFMELIWLVTSWKRRD